MLLNVQHKSDKQGMSSVSQAGPLTATFPAAAKQCMLFAIVVHTDSIWYNTMTSMSRDSAPRAVRQGRQSLRLAPRSGCNSPQQWSPGRDAWGQVLKKENDSVALDALLAGNGATQGCTCNITHGVNASRQLENSSVLADDRKLSCLGIW